MDGRREGWTDGGMDRWMDRHKQGPKKFFAAYKQISLIGSVPTKFTINSTTNWGLFLQAALACSPTSSDPAQMANTPTKFPIANWKCFHFGSYLDNLEISILDKDSRLGGVKQGEGNLSTKFHFPRFCHLKSTIFFCFIKEKFFSSLEAFWSKSVLKESTRSPRLIF